MKPLPAARGFSGKPAPIKSSRTLRLDYARFIKLNGDTTGIGDARVVSGRTIAVAIAPGFKFESLFEFRNGELVQ